jgi:hypothetical protein
MSWNRTYIELRETNKNVEMVAAALIVTGERLIKLFFFSYFHVFGTLLFALFVKMDKK